MQTTFNVIRNSSTSKAFFTVSGLTLALAATLPFWGESSWMREFVEIACYLIFAMMWNLLAGYG
ncbi:MAG: branched-chain amino acid ABC transporter permease, partial [Burkholderiales bacterium]